MANLNETECQCMGIYNAATGSCDAATPEVACPSENGGFWQTVGGLDWNAISETSLQWGYALGLLTPPNAAQLTNQVYMAELTKQRQQMNMIMIGLGVIMIIVLLIVLRKKK